MSCLSFFENTGWHCSTIKHNNVDVVYISTPITLLSGKPLDFYLTYKADYIEITDDGLTMFELRSAGYDFATKHNWNSIESIITKYGFTLAENGSICAIIHKNELKVYGENILLMFSAITFWDEEKRNENDKDFTLTNEVEKLLRFKAPEITLIKDPIIKLHNYEAKFNFLWGSIYIDAIKPTPQSTNSRLRKSLLANKYEDNISILYIIDDRDTDIEKVDREIAVLGQISNAMRFKDFKEKYHYKN